MRSKLRIFECLLAVLVVSAYTACEPKIAPDPDPNGKEEENSTTLINGTTIQEGNNLVGLIKDSQTGKGIAGVPVTDGYTYTETDENGVYQFAANRYCRKVYYSLPAEYEAALDEKTKLPLFYSTSTIDRTVVNRNDFVLKPLSSKEKDFTLIMIGDPQCKTDAEVERFRVESMLDIKATASQARKANKNVYAITLGDLTFDNTVQWEPMQKNLSKAKLEDGSYLPIYNCIGNHDHDASASADFASTKNFVDYFGPTDYSFNRGDAHIVVMDNVMCTSSNGSTWEYNGGFTASQLKWLKADIAKVKNKSSKMIILCCHIPFRGSSESGGANVNKDKNYEEVLKLLQGFNEAHIMIGHTHYQQNYIHSNYTTKNGLPIYEHIHGGTCGAWWSCNLNTDGTPNGYCVYEISGNTMANWRFKATGMSESVQMRVYDGNQVYGEDPVGPYIYKWYSTSNKGGGANITAVGNKDLVNSFVVSIWNGDPVNWSVALYHNGSKVGNLQRVGTSICDICAASFFFNVLGKNTTTWTTRTSQHYWYIKAPGGEPSKLDNWEIRATHTIPGSGTENVYISTTLQKDYSGFSAN